MSRYRARADVEIDAMQWTGGNLDKIVEWMGVGPGTAARPYAASSLTLWVVRSHAHCKVRLGGWIVRERNGDGFYPCTDQEFTERWEPIGDPS